MRHKRVWSSRGHNWQRALHLCLFKEDKTTKNAITLHWMSFTIVKNWCITLCCPTTASGQHAQLWYLGKIGQRDTSGERMQDSNWRSMDSRKRAYNLFPSFTKHVSQSLDSISLTHAAKGKGQQKWFGGSWMLQMVRLAIAFLVSNPSGFPCGTCFV